MKKIDLEILDVSHSGTSSGAYAMVLVEKNGNRRLPIIIGPAVAQAIAIELENMKPSRPLTHDLFKTSLTTFGLSVEEVFIYKYEEGVFFSKLIITDGSKTIEIDARSSDAVAIALRFRAPIRCAEAILDSMGISPGDAANEEVESDFDNDDDFDEGGEIVFESDMGDFEKSEENNEKDLVDLRKKLEIAIENEDYESAAQIQKSIEKIESKK